MPARTARAAVTLRAATRGSPLALCQTDHVAKLLVADHAAKPLTGTCAGGVEPVVVQTTGDRLADTPIHTMGGKGVFVKEVQAAVLDGRADIAVHSAKDLPSETPPGLVLAAILKRGDPRDALVGCRLAELPPGALVATGSVRRRAQLAWLRPDLAFAELRGNIATRLEKAADYHAIVMAAVALDRLGINPETLGKTDRDAMQSGKTDRDAMILDKMDPDAMILNKMDPDAMILDKVDPDTMILDKMDPDTIVPQAGQGAIAVECRADDHTAIALLAAIEHGPTRRAVDAERAFLAELGGGCNLPAGAYATSGCCLSGCHPSGHLELTGLLASPDGRTVLKETHRGSDPVALGRAVARRLLDGMNGSEPIAMPQSL